EQATMIFRSSFAAASSVSQMTWRLVTLFIHRLQFAHRALVLFGAHHAVMPLRVVLHEGDSLALHRVRDDGSRHPLAVLCRLISRNELRTIVPVHDFDNVPPERLELLAKRRAVHDF